MPTVVHEKTMYLGTYLIDDKAPGATGEVTLLVRTYRVTQGPSGRQRLHIKTDVEEYPTVEAMLESIEARGLEELPPAADGDPRYVPVEFRGNQADTT